MSDDVLELDGILENSDYLPNDPDDNLPKDNYHSNLTTQWTIQEADCYRERPLGNDNYSSHGSDDNLPSVSKQRTKETTNQVLTGSDVTQAIDTTQQAIDTTQQATIDTYKLIGDNVD